jgi:hypothetical protein
MTMTFSPHKLAGRKCGVCSISEQNENEMRSANATRRDQRTFRCGVTRARRGRKKEKRSRVALPSAARRRLLRSGFVPAVSPLRFTFPLAEPLTEACRWLTWLLKCQAETNFFVTKTAYFL